MSDESGSSTFSTNARRLFVVVEVMAVLVIIVVSLNAFWRAAGSVYRHIYVSRASEEARQIVQSVRTHLAGQTATGISLSKNLINSGLVSADMVKMGNIVDPWGNEMRIEIGNSGLMIGFKELGSKDCARLVTEISGRGQTDGLASVLSLTGQHITAFPPSDRDLEQACKDSHNFVAFFYKVKN